MKPTRENPLVDLALGAVAGAAATWVMGKATTYLYEKEDQQARQREDQARGGSTAYETAAKKAAGFAGRELSEEESKKLGSAIHWAIGVSAGAVHGLLRRRLAGRGLGGNLALGALFGTAVWLLLDEAGNTVLGLTPGPKAFPWQTHARGLAGHLVLGLTTEGLMQAADLAA
jgi:hypothetical protein